MKIHQRQARNEISKKKQNPWAFKRPRTCTSKKTARPTRHQATKSQTTIIKRHLASTNKRLSAHTGKRAKKLRKRDKNILRLRQQCANVLSKKVNKDHARLKRTQSEKTIARARTKTTTKLRLALKYSRKTSEIEQNPGHLIALLPPRQEQVICRY